MESSTNSEFLGFTFINASLNQSDFIEIFPNSDSVLPINSSTKNEASIIKDSDKTLEKTNDLNQERSAIKFAKDLCLPGELNPKTLSRIVAFQNLDTDLKLRLAKDKILNEPQYKLIEGKSSQGQFLKYKRNEIEGSSKKGVSLEKTPDEKMFALLGVLLGRGAYKKVTIASSLTLDLVARSTIEFNSPLEEKAISQEISLQRKFDDDRIVKIFYFYIFEPKYVIISEYCNFGELKNLPLNYRTEEILLPIFRQLLGALEQFEIEGIIHRDIKSSNIFLHQTPDKSIHAKIGDFGFALGNERGELKSKGTPYYQPPEFIDLKKLSSKTDLWAMGLVIYESTFSKLLLSELYQEKNKKRPCKEDFLRFLKELKQTEVINFLETHKHSQGYDTKNKTLFENKIIEFLKIILIVTVESRPTSSQAYQIYQKQFGIIN